MCWNREREENLSEGWAQAKGIDMVCAGQDLTHVTEAQGTAAEKHITGALMTRSAER